jgi:hypothetical protein
MLTAIKTFHVSEFGGKEIPRFEDAVARDTLDTRQLPGDRQSMLRKLGRTQTLVLPVKLALFTMILLVSSQTNAESKTGNPPCQISPADYKGWQAQQISNRWVQLLVVPQNGGRLIQVTFAGHAYLFVNPKYEGKYFPPTQSKWFNYGGDKIWLLPEGNDDELHWPGGSDVIDDGPFTFRKISEGQQCEVELTSPADPQSGIQFVRTIHLDADSPRIKFHVNMKNITGHAVEWSMQSVSQYDTSNAANRSRLNNDFWAFTPANPSSQYLNRYHVRFGPAENRAASVRDDGMFVIHYAHMAAELWLDSTAGQLAVVDGDSGFTMVERFRYEEKQPYPGHASMIFWTNGPGLKLSEDGIPSLGSDEEEDSPYYMEAEINSPVCRLRPGESCNLDTEWFPTRGGRELQAFSEGGIIARPLRVTRLASGKLKLSGSFGVFFPGRLVARLYDDHGASLGTMPIVDANPAEAVSLDQEISCPDKVVRLSLHLESDGVDRGSLQEVRVQEESR